MNYRRILAAAAAICLSFGAVALPAQTCTSGTAAYAVDEVDIADIVLPNVGDSVPVEVTGDTAVARWYSDDDSVATITPAPDNKMKAVVTATGVGRTAVYAYVAGKLLKYTVLVENEAGPADNRVCIGKFTLTNQLDGATLKITGADPKDVLWSTSDEKVATVDSEGNIRAVDKGSCTVTGIYNGVTYYAEITSEYEPLSVLIPEYRAGSIKLSDAEPTKKVQADVPEGTVMVWSSTNEAVATVADGLVSATGKGECRIYAEANGVRYYFEVESEFTGESAGKLLGSIELTDKAPSKKPKLDGVPEGVTPVWSSSDENVAAVDQDGKITGKSTGNCNIIVTIGESRYYFAVTSKVTGGTAGLVGDANLDKKVSVADAVAILQSIANRDKYELKPQGAINADVDGVSGVTAMDALVIQQFDSGFVTELPVKPAK